MSGPVKILYRNWRGEVAVRTIRPEGIWFGKTQWHPEPQWLLVAIDLDRPGEYRKDYAMAGILAWGEQAIASLAKHDAASGAEGEVKGDSPS